MGKKLETLANVAIGFGASAGLYGGIGSVLGAFADSVSGHSDVATGWESNNRNDGNFDEHQRRVIESRDSQEDRYNSVAAALEEKNAKVESIGEQCVVLMNEYVDGELAPRVFFNDDNRPYFDTPQISDEQTVEFIVAEPSAPCSESPTTVLATLNLLKDQKLLEVEYENTDLNEIVRSRQEAIDLLEEDLRLREKDGDTSGLRIGFMIGAIPGGLLGAYRRGKYGYTFMRPY